MVMNKEKLKADIFEWLYTHDGIYDSKLDWRDEFIKFLHDRIDRSFESEATVSGSIRLGSEETIRGMSTGPLHITSDLPTPYPVTVDYSKSLKQMIKAGKYDRVNEDISYKNFKLAGVLSATKDVFLMSYDETMSSEEVEKDLDKKGMRACILPELLALGAQYPELQKEHYIVALGSRGLHPGGSGYVPGLFEVNGRRWLGIYWYGSQWNQNYRFAAVAK